MENRYLRAWAEIDIDAIRSNVKKLQENLNKNTKTCAVIKANGYGHGAVRLARELDDLADYYAVATIEEALELRTDGISKPILILGFVHPSRAEEAVLNDIRLTVYDPEYAEIISDIAVSLGKQAKIHLKIDTGMSRIGFIPNDSSFKDIVSISKLKGIDIEGIFTHFAKADDQDLSDAYKRLDLFLGFVERLEAENIKIPIRHCANSAAATCMKEAELDMVRLGISIYGLYPSEYVNKVTLRPAMSLKSHIIMVKEVPEGTGVGYGGTWTAEGKRRIATVSIGYADGYMRGLSNKGYVLIRGVKCPVVGRVCMDQIMTDVTGMPLAKAGDEVILVGTDGDQTITVEEISELAGSFNYEFVCNISSRVERIYHRH